MGIQLVLEIDGGRSYEIIIQSFQSSKRNFQEDQELVPLIINNYFGVTN